MSLFDLFERVFDRTSKEAVEYDKKYNSDGKGGKLFKIINTVCILGIFVAIGLTVIGMFGVLKFTPATFGAIATTACVCICCWMLLPWVAYYEQKKHPKLCLTFIIMDIAVPALWIFAIWFFVIKVTASSLGAGTLTFIQVVLLISLQFSVVSLIANTILRYGKRLIVIQIIAYISYVYFDFYLSFAISCVSFSNTDGVSFSGALHVLGNRTMLALFFLSLVYVTIAFSIINGRSRRRRRRTLTDTPADLLPDDNYDNYNYNYNSGNASTDKSYSTEAQLEELRKLLDKNLITQAEYEEKRRNILNRM